MPAPRESGAFGIPVFVAPGGSKQRTTRQRAGLRDTIARKDDVPMAQNAEALHDAPPGALDDAPETTVADVPDASNDASDGPDLDAMAAFLGLQADNEADHDAGGKAPDVKPAADAAGEDEPLTPAQQAVLDKKRKDLEAGYTPKYQQVRAMERELAEREQRLAAREAALEVAREQGPAGQAPTAGPKPVDLDAMVDDLTDPDGYVDMGKFKQFAHALKRSVREEVEAEVVGKHVRPVADKVDASAKAEAERIQLDYIATLQKTEEYLQQMCPSYADPDVRGKIYEYIQKHQRTDAVDIVGAFKAVFPGQWQKDVYEFNARRKKQSGGQAPPATPPGRQSKTRQALPPIEDEEARLDAMSARAAELLGVARR